MSHNWNTKVRVNQVLKKQGATHTHENIFKMSPSKVNPKRIESLILGESKGRNFNPVTGTAHYNM